MPERPHLLYLVHRIPFPPNKGDKIRSFHVLRELAQEFQVHLGTFIDDPDDKQYQADLEPYCASSHYSVVNAKWRTARASLGFLTGESITTHWYRDQAMRQWVNATVAQYNIEKVLVFSSAMAQFVLGEQFTDQQLVVDFVDVDSEKWTQYASSKPAYSAWIYTREARILRSFEQKVAERAAQSVLVSATEAELFRERTGLSSERVSGVANGVDSEFFDPAIASEAPFAEDGPHIVFTGAMNYWANEDAVKWFVDEAWPLVLQQQPDAHFYIVGMGPTSGVKALADNRITVTGKVDDVRPYVRHADVIIAPMRIARGIQNKVLEGMSMGRPVVASSKGFEGIDATPGTELIVADEAEDFAAACLQAIAGEYAEIGTAARARIVADYSWQASVARMIAHLHPAT